MAAIHLFAEPGLTDGFLTQSQFPFDYKLSPGRIEGFTVFETLNPLCIIRNVFKYISVVAVASVKNQKDDLKRKITQKINGRERIFRHKI